jgi:hypothetical protein
VNGTYEIVINNTKKIESLLKDKLSAEGRGLHTQAESVQDILDQKVAKKIHYIATIRNNLMHEVDFKIPDIDLFEKDCKRVIQYLSETEFKRSSNSKSFNSKDSSLKKSYRIFGKPLLFFICGSLLLPFILYSNPNQVEAPLQNILLTSLTQGFAFAGIYWGYTFFSSWPPLFKLLLFPLIMIVGMAISPFKIYQGIREVTK